VPYIGAIVAAIFPLIVSTAVDPGWSIMLMTAALFLVVEPLIGQVIEPMVYGHSRRTFASGRHSVRNILDMALGTDRAHPRDAIDHVSGCAWPACGTPKISGGFVGQSARTDAQ